MKAEWQRGVRPPQDEVVECVLWDGSRMNMRARFGCDGMLPHWESEDRGFLVEPSGVVRWRRLHTEGGSRAVQVLGGERV